LPFRISPQETYHVRLQLFEGPLDLLLHLIEREELDITRISLAQVTDQYLAHIDQLEELHAENLADFLVIAARLLLIKSQMLLPRPKSDAIPEEEEDPGEALARQLRAYKRFKEVAQQLKERADAGWQTFLRIAPPPRLPRKVDLDGVTLNDLLEAMRQALIDRPAKEVAPIGLPELTITVADQMAHLRNRLKRERRVTFSSLISENRSRVQIVVTFLAVLEMFKAQEITLYQDRLFGEIQIEAVPAPATANARN
jgi:segregation and condensation protein A